MQLRVKRVYEDGVIGLTPVSYTHLDVYKRQGFTRYKRKESKFRK